VSERHQLFLLLRPTSNVVRLGGITAVVDIRRYASDAELAAYVSDVQPDAVIHTACAYGRRGESILQITDSNVRFGLAIIHSLLATNRPVTFINTDTALAPEVSTYALTKHQFAVLGRHLSAQSSGRLQFINVLLQQMLGPGDDPFKFTTSVIHACYRNDPELKLTAGEQRRDIVYIDDVIDAYSILLSKRSALESAPEIEVGSGFAPTIREFVEAVHRLTQSKTELVFGALSYRCHEAMYCRADISQMKTLGWSPRFDLESGIKRTIDLEFTP